LQAALRRAGRQRGIVAATVRLQAIFRRTWLHQLPMVEQAMGCQALALLKQLEAAEDANAWSQFCLTPRVVHALLKAKQMPR